MQLESNPQRTEYGRLSSPHNPLFVMARAGHLRLPKEWLEQRPVLIDKILYPLIVLLFAFLVPQISAIIGLPLTAVAFGLSDSQPDLSFTLILVGSFLPIFFLIWLWLGIVERRPLWTTGLRPPILKPYLRGLLIGLLLFGTTVLFLGGFGFLEVENSNAQQAAWITIGGTVLVFCGWMVQGAAEEILARGFLMPILGVRWGPTAGVLVSSLLFSVLHLLNPNLSFLSLANLFLFGLFAALFALYEGGLWGAFAIHAIWNWAQGNLFGFEVSGLSIRSSILIDLAETGPDWLTGGLFGPEGGFVVTLVLLSGISLLLLLSRRQKRLGLNEWLGSK